MESPESLESPQTSPTPSEAPAHPGASPRCPSRRTALAAAGALGAAALVAGCSGGGSDDESGARLARVSDIPVGGGKVLKDHKVVVTQPVAGEFKAFSAVCTHQGCTVTRVANGMIECPCHGSRFRITDGVMTSGPAPRPLPAEEIKVTGDTIVRA
ncbi:Rieske (2Fe-2S) protein [Streptomyces laurentii]|uniref:Rieske (2Fe-2S) protein n=1 Tax=Streptomyces laurentii TaxID=39478 RepID=UPI0036A14680